MAGAFMLAAPTTIWGAEQKKPEDAALVVQRMETHWRTLIQEDDPARRKALVADHRQMMAEARTALGAAPSGPMGGHRRHDLQNTMEIHSMMLDMMK